MKNGVRKIGLWIFCAAGFCVPVFAAEPPVALSSSAGASKALQARLEAMHTLEGSFQQTIRNEKSKILQRLSGKLWLKKPGHFRWEVSGEEPRLIIADGIQVWDYDKELEQVTVQKLKTGKTQAPIFFLSGDASTLNKDFKIIALPLKNGVCLSGSDACFALIPKQDEGAFQAVRIGFEANLLKEMLLLDQLGQNSQFIFKNVRVNVPIAAAQFKFTPPKGVDVLKND